MTLQNDVAALATQADGIISPNKPLILIVINETHCLLQMSIKFYRMLPQISAVKPVADLAKLKSTNFTFNRRARIEKKMQFILKESAYTPRYS